MNFNLNNYGALIISGSDAARFLQGQLTCDVTKILSSQLAAHCAPNGRVQTLFFINQQQDQFQLIMPLEMLTLAHNHLKKYAIFFNVTMVTDTETLITATAPPVATLQLNNIQARVDELPCTSWQLRMMQHGIPMIYASTTNLFLPHEINLPQLNAISFNKGCFTGQEIIARMEYKGKIKKALHFATILSPTTLEPGVAIQAQQKAIGTVVDRLAIGPDVYATLVLLDESSDLNQAWEIQGQPVRQSLTAFK